MAVGSLHGRFSTVASRTPHAVAIRDGNVELTYGDVDRRANRLAHLLIRLGVRAETPVAVLMERSADLIVAMLAVLKAGGCYLPLHTANPVGRSQVIVELAGAPVLLADAVSRSRGLPSGPHTVLVAGEDGLEDLPDAAPVVGVERDQACYIMYTSGSTGVPKGVVTTHRGVLSLVADPCWTTGHHDRVLMVAPHAFSVSAYEVWVPLTRGGQVVVAPPDVDVATLARLIGGGEVTAVHLAAGLFRVMAEEVPTVFAGVREVLTGGDTIAPGAVQRVLQAAPDTVVRAMYGATEVTLFATAGFLSAVDAVTGILPVGRPLRGVGLYVLDDALQPVAPGTPGELYVTGRLARGYLKRPDLTAERFVADPFTETPGSRMYRTGDLVRVDEDGTVYFLGRTGSQVKIRGFRVELGEIEAVVSALPGVADVLVVADCAATQEIRLIAYVVPAAHAIATVDGIRDRVRGLLPDFMVPQVIIPIAGLPLTPNGKVDRAALPPPPAPDGDGSEALAEPMEQKLCGLFAEVLGTDRIGMDDDFFALGGQSLAAMQLISKVKDALGVDLPSLELFDAPTVRKLAERVAARLAAAEVPTSLGYPD